MRAIIVKIGMVDSFQHLCQSDTRLPQIMAYMGIYYGYWFIQMWKLYSIHFEYVYFEYVISVDLSVITF